jgi:hypothetical protein
VNDEAILSAARRCSIGVESRFIDIDLSSLEEVESDECRKSENEASLVKERHLAPYKNS